MRFGVQVLVEHAAVDLANLVEEEPLPDDHHPPRDPYVVG
jgi:hypothetical protein